MRYNKFGERVVEAVLDTNVISDLVILVTNEEKFKTIYKKDSRKLASLIVLNEIIIEELNKDEDHRGFVPMIDLTTNKELMAGINKSNYIDDEFEKEYMSKLASLNRRYDIEINDHINNKQYGYVYDCLSYVSTFYNQENLKDHRIMATAALKNFPVITDDNHFFGVDGKVKKEIENQLKIYQANARKNGINVEIDQAKPYKTFDFIKEFFPEKVKRIETIIEELDSNISRTYYQPEDSEQNGESRAPTRYPRRRRKIIPSLSSISNETPNDSQMANHALGSSPVTAGQGSIPDEKNKKVK